MSLFDEIKSQVGTALGGSSSPLVAAVGKLLISQETGGLQGMVDAFRQKGLGQVVDSWVSVGKNLPITPDQIMQALGDQRVQKLAAAAGIDVQSASAKLAEIRSSIRLLPMARFPRETCSRRA
jgi:uncharacterized protein YidB (DUF937 family)